MNGVHDMGGMDGFGKVEAEPNEPVFHADWEARVMALVRAMGAAGAFNIDTSRFYREALPPHVYLSSSYYKKWLLGLENLLVDKGFVAPDEVKAGHALKQTKAPKRGKFTRDDVERIMVRGKFGRPLPRRPSSRRATGCARRTSIRQRIRGCRATCAGMSAWSSAITAARCFRIRPRSRRARIRNGFIRSRSTRPNCGAPTPTRR
jgi:hypothetical protein